MYVDDTLIATKGISEADNLNAQLKAEIRIKYLGVVNMILRMNIYMKRQERQFLSPQYTKKAFKRFNVLADPVKTPLSTHFDL